MGKSDRRKPPAMKRCEASYRFHVSTRLLVEVVERGKEYVLVVAVGGTTPPRRWSRAFLERETRPVAADGYRFTESHETRRVARWIAKRSPSVLHAMVRDEQAHGRAGLRKQAIRDYLQDQVPPDELDIVSQELQELLEKHRSFLKVGQGAKLVYTTRQARCASGDELARLAKALGLWRQGQVPKPLTQEKLAERARELLEAVRTRGQPREEDLKLLVQVIGNEGLLLPADVTTLAAKLVSRLVSWSGKKSWSSFKKLAANVQEAAVAQVTSRIHLQYLLWMPGLKPTVRTGLLSRMLTESLDLGATTSIPEGGYGHAAQLVQAADEVVEAAPPDRRPEVARSAVQRLLGIAPEDVDIMLALPALKRLARAAPEGAALQWVADATKVLAQGKSQEPRRWAGRLAAAVGGKSEGAHATATALTVGSTVMGSTRGLGAAYAALTTADEVHREVERWLATLKAGDIRAVVKKREPVVLARQDTTTDHRLAAANDLIEKITGAHAWEAMAHHYLSLVSAFDQAARECKAAHALADDPDHARGVLGEVQRAGIVGVHEAAAEDARASVQREIDALRSRAATTLADTLTAVQTVRFNLGADTDAARQLGAVERRVATLARRWGWQVVGRAWETVDTIDLDLHDVEGDTAGTPVVTRVGIRETKGEDSMVLVKARVVRKASLPLPNGGRDATS